MSFDWTITLGGLLTASVNLLAIVIGAVVLYYKTREWVFKLHLDNKSGLNDIRQTLKGMEPKLDAMWDWFIRRRNGS